MTLTSRLQGQPIANAEGDSAHRLTGSILREGSVEPNCSSLTLHLPGVVRAQLKCPRAVAIPAAGPGLGEAMLSFSGSLKVFVATLPCLTRYCPKQKTCVLRRQIRLNNDHGSLRFRNLGVDYMIHHLLSHSDTDDWLKVNQFFLEQVAYITRNSIPSRKARALCWTIQCCCSAPPCSPAITTPPNSRLCCSAAPAAGSKTVACSSTKKNPTTNVPPVSVYDGQDGRSSTQVRRCQPAIGPKSKTAAGPGPRTVPSMQRCF